MKFLKNIFIVFAAFILAIPVYSLASSPVHKSTHVSFKSAEKQKSSACKEDAELLEESEESDFDSYASDILPHQYITAFYFNEVVASRLLKRNYSLVSSIPRYLIINRLTI